MVREVLQAFLDQVGSSHQQGGVCTEHDADKIVSKIHYEHIYDQHTTQISTINKELILFHRQFNLAFLNKGNRGSSIVWKEYAAWLTQM